ncbi:PREDICTED: uncharacterized protein LOC109206814 [Nicotiana attenuata]|uniref:uncharacterized protein LOC109206814 n=1 Tax=Nicotiana attenuata TaxID=49451 RepID=UPI000904B826|nr:PREDICTED: uncharacterized protein LOC109206814 [Nicotiana attenuata]
MENENRALKEQMKKHRERVDKIPGAPKLLPKRELADAGLFHRNIRKKMMYKFVTAYAGAKKAKTRVNDIFSITQSPWEGQKDFLARFNRVRMTLPNVSEGMAVASFQNGPKREGSKTTKKLLSRLMKYPPATWSTHSRSSKQKSDDFCEFHQDGEQKMEDCNALRLEVVNLLQYGHLKELLGDKGRKTLAKGRECPGPPKKPSPAHTINMVIGGSDDASINGIKFTTTYKLNRSITHERYEDLEESIIFDESDANGLTFLQNDALVITLRIFYTDVRRIMVDDGSGAYIIHPRVLTQMRHEDKIMPRWITLIDFSNTVERTSGEITLPVLAGWGGGVTLETTFHIMDQETRYNTIIDRPWIHPMSYLQDGVLPNVKKEARKLRMQAARYKLLHNELYKRTYGGPLAKCFGPNQTQCVLENVDEGHSDSHPDDRSLVWFPYSRLRRLNWATGEVVFVITRNGLRSWSFEILCYANTGA